MATDRKDALRRRLQEAREQLLAVLDQVGEADWQMVVFADDAQWTVKDLLGHLTEAERGLTIQADRIRHGSEGVPADFDLNRYNASVVRKKKERSIPELLADLERNRQQLWQLLDDLSDEELDQKGRHADLRILSVEQILGVIAAHDLGHAADLARVLEG